VLQLEAVRTLATRKESAAIAADNDQPSHLRTEALLGTDDTALLQKLATHEDTSIRSEAQRALRFSGLDTSFTMPTDRPPFDQTTAWLARLDALPGQPDPEAGRRLFFNPKVALCATCHRHSGRGNVLGPDLTLAARQGDRAALLSSILEPHREVAPQFYPSQIKLKDGSEFIGILLRSSSTEVFRDLTGKERSFPKPDIVSRTELKTSLMPAGLVTTLTDTELRDLLTFLTQAP
jgi:putative heme-binding domain-containing protein